MKDKFYELKGTPGKIFYRMKGLNTSEFISPKKSLKITPLSLNRTRDLVNDLKIKRTMKKG